ncbi:hypothetical protein [Agromyces albus]|uniref:hypothetical protein n=1 Tax=Agromyces albus TaxID=205332 RepID=UPI0027D81D77|nr:hypothetical protein [Agromyces albus]
MSDEYVSNLDVRPEDVVYTDRRKWLLNLAKSAASSKIHLLLNAGEATINSRYLLDRLVMLPIFLLIRIRRGSVVQTGTGLRNVEHNSMWVTRVLLGMASVVTWRDDQSRRAVGLGGVQPDWGFFEGEPSDIIASRQSVARARRLVLSIRGDRTPPSKGWIEQTWDVLNAEGISAVVVCQVRRDEPRLRWLAAQLGADYVGWDADADHAEQEAQVRAVYAGATWVVSDRLHVLVAAVTEGCVILPWLPDRGEKLARTLAGAGMTYDFARALPRAFERNSSFSGQHPESSRAVSESTCTTHYDHSRRNGGDHVQGSTILASTRFRRATAAPDPSARSSQEGRVHPS